MKSKITTLNGNIIEIKHDAPTIQTYFEGWADLKDFACEIEIAEGIKKIEESAFEGFSNLKKVKLPDTLEYIGDFAFKECKKLKSVDVPWNVWYIGQYAFGSCSSLRKVNLNKTIITKISTGVFNHCEKLRSILLPEWLEIIGEYAFAFCYSLESIEISKSVFRIENQAFFDCTKLNDFNIPKCDYVGLMAFANTKYALNPNNYKNNLLIKDGVVLDGREFDKKELTLNEERIVLSNGCFRENSKLTYLNINCEEVYIGDESFAFSALEKVTIKSGKEGFVVFNQKAFANTYLKEVDVETSYLYIQEKAFFSVITLDKLKIKADELNLENFCLADKYIEEFEINNNISVTIREYAFFNTTVNTVMLKEVGRYEKLSIPDNDFLEYVLTDLCTPK